MVADYKNIQSKKLLTREELMIYLSIGKDKAHSLLHTEGFPTVRLGRKIYANRTMLDDWIDNITESNKNKEVVK